MNQRIIANPIWLTDSIGLEIQVRTFVATNIDVWIQIFADLPTGAEDDPLSSVAAPSQFKDYDESRIKPMLTVIPSASITADGSLNSFFISLKRGNLVNVTVGAEAVALRHGDCYIIGNLRAFPNANAPIVATILRGYVTSIAPIFYPGENMEGNQDGVGSPIVIHPANPGAGANLNVPVPANTIWLIKSITLVLATAVAVGNRVVSGYYRQTTGGNIINVWGASAGAPQPASTTNLYTFALLNPISTTSNNTYGNGSINALPTVYLTPAETIETDIATIQAADQISNVFLQVERWVSL